MKLPRHAHRPFGADRFGILAERFARFFGTPQYIIGQTILVIIWIAFNVLWLTRTLHFDPYPFILLNLLFSTQAAYAAPLILLAETRQAERDAAQAEADAHERKIDREWQADVLERLEVLGEMIHDHQLRGEKE